MPDPHGWTFSPGIAGLSLGILGRIGPHHPMVRPHDPGIGGAPKGFLLARFSLSTEFHRFHHFKLFEPAKKSGSNGLPSHPRKIYVETLKSKP